ncbi:MAG: hypothetical protein WDO14_22440 [Bacteroidota bacterium]
MIAVLTGDIVSSRKAPDKKWLARLSEVIEKKSSLKKAPKWTIFRGDGFQIELPEPEKALQVALIIRSGLRSVPQLFEQGIDARIGIGIGEKEFTGKSISESDGQAYQLSGGVLDSLKNDKYKLHIKTPWPEVDLAINVALQLASVVIDDWSLAESEIAWLWLTEGKTQVEMAKKLKITQPAIHKRFAGAHLSEISDLLTYYHDVVSHHTKSPKK